VKVIIGVISLNLTLVNWSGW